MAAVPGRVRSKIEALSDCDGYLKPRDLMEQLENEREWFQLLDILRQVRWQRTSLRENPRAKRWF
jgi:hypothetical protein